MPDVPLPFAIIQWMRDRRWGDHHLEWHTTRQWDRLSPAEQAEAAALGWQRASRQEGEATNGFEFLMMHRAMLQLLREEFPTLTDLFAGWPTPPTDPADPNDPVPRRESADVSPRDGRGHRAADQRSDVLRRR